MSDTILTTLPASFPAGYCPSSTQQLANDIASGQRVLFPNDFAMGVTGPNEPGVEERSKVWFRTDSSTFIITGVFRYSPSYGVWLQDHWRGYGVPSNERRLFAGSAADVDYFDGGEPGTVSDTTGPFWQIATAWANKVPIGVGTVAVETNDATLVGADGTKVSVRGVYVLQTTGRLYDRG